MKTNDYANAIMRREDLATDYKLAKFLGLSFPAVRNWRKKGTTADDKSALKFAEVLGIDPAKVLADIHAERSKTPEERKVWQRIAKQFGHAAALLLIVNLSSGGSGAAQASQSNQGLTESLVPNNVYYVKLQYKFSGPTYTEYLLHKDYADAWRLESTAHLVWSAFKGYKRRLKLSSLGMKYYE